MYIYTSCYCTVTVIITYHDTYLCNVGGSLHCINNLTLPDKGIPSHIRKYRDIINVDTAKFGYIKKFFREILNSIGIGSFKMKEVTIIILYLLYFSDRYLTYCHESQLF
uniref:Uncharacterized protein n=1 Tax=Cotesia sesamiae Kitale bracovirus TaxID=452648 RepID=S0DHB4_9VIRU|nr:hypothetical unknown protein [Cotesia sesamiae Kitale bracovirus]